MQQWHPVAFIANGRCVSMGWAGGGGVLQCKAHLCVLNAL